MDANELLRQVTIPSPCSARWEEMEGDDRARVCSACGKEVYNFEALTAAEAAALVGSRGEGGVCGQIRRAGDGSIVTRDGAGRRFRMSLRGVMAGIAGIAAALGLARFLWRTERPGVVTVGEMEVMRTAAPASACAGTSPPAVRGEVSAVAPLPRGQGVPPGADVGGAETTPGSRR
jgi:hypothetical protein